LAGLSINLAREQEIYRGIVQYRRYPDEIFTLLISMECRLKRAVESGVCRQLSLDPIEGRTMRGF